MKLILAAFAAAGALVLISIVLEVLAAAQFEDEYDPYEKPFGMP